MLAPFNRPATEALALLMYQCALVRRHSRTGLGSCYPPSARSPSCHACRPLVFPLVSPAGCRLWFLPAYSPDFNPIRARLRQAQGLPAQSPGALPGHFTNRHRRSPGHHHRQRRARLVQALPVPSACSILLKTVVSDSCGGLRSRRVSSH